MITYNDRSHCRSRYFNSLLPWTLLGCPLCEHGIYPNHLLQNSLTRKVLSKVFYKMTSHRIADRG